MLHPRQCPEERVERLLGVHGLEHDNVHLEDVARDPNPFQGCESGHHIDGPPMHIVLEDDRRSADSHVFSALFAEVGCESSLREIDTELFERDLAPLGLVGYHDRVRVCHAELIEFGRDLSGGDGAAEFLVDSDRSSSGIQLPSHLHIKGPLKYMLTSKKTYLHGIAGLVRVWTPEWMDLAVAARADLWI